MSDAPDTYLPSGLYFVSNRHCPLIPGEPNSKITVPLVYQQRHIVSTGRVAGRCDAGLLTHIMYTHSGSSHG